MRWTMVSLLLVSAAQAEPPVPRQEAAEALRKAVHFFRKEVAVEGGYVWKYSEDLSRREGEGKVTATTVWVQPPGTPAVGLAFLTAFEATGDRQYLEAARETALALVRGQLRSGGWNYFIDFDPKGAKPLAYRAGGKPNARNFTVLDDNTTQTALRLVMRVDRALEFKDAKIHEAAEYALASLLQAQYPAGAWPQGYDKFPDPAKYPVKQASFPAEWSRTYPGGDYWWQYTLNDNCLADLVETMVDAERIYGDAKYRGAAEKAGGFLIRAQLPEPQPAWAQQYSFNMHPAWARKFEPPAVTGGESQGALRTLLLLCRETGDKKYLAPVPRALDYLRKSRLPDGRLARFYELKTNKPLYLTRDYKLTDSDADLPTHYGFKVSAEALDGIAKEYDRLQALDPAELKKRPVPGPPKLTPELTTQVKAVLAAQDARGRWVDEGRLRYHGPTDPTTRVIDPRTFIRNVEILSQYLAATGRE